MKSQPKNTVENLPSWIISFVILQVLFFIPEFVSFLKYKKSLSDLYSSFLTDIKGHLYFYLFGILNVIVFIVYIGYMIWKKQTIRSGIKHSGKIVGSISSLSQVNRKSTMHYKYKVELEDGQIVFTQNYLDNEIERLNLRSCTVYEYKGKFVFCDFK